MASAEMTAAAARLSRLVLAARALALDPAPLVAALARLGGSLAEAAWCFVEPPFTGIGVIVPWPREPAHAAEVRALLAERSPGLSALDGLLARSARTRELIVNARADGPSFALRIAGTVPLADDLARATALAGLTDAARDALEGAAGGLAGPRGLVSDAFEMAGDGAVTLHLRLADVDLAPRLDRVLERLGVTGAQRRLVGTLHPALATGGVVVVGLTAARGSGAVEAAVAWAAQPWEDVVRLVQGIYPAANAGDRLGSLAGALGAERVEAVELRLGASEPPGLRVASAVAAGAPDPSMKK